MAETTIIILIAAAAMVASFTQRVSGFGFGIFMMTLLPHVMPSYGEATALSGLLAIVTALLPAVAMRKHVNMKKLWPILLTFIVVSFFAVFLVTKVDSHSMKRILGAILIAVSIYFFFFSGKIKVRPNMPTQISMGTISGMMGGLFGMQGPPAVIYFIECCESKEEYIALTQWYFLIGNIMMTFFRAQHGFVTATVGKSFAFGVIGVLAGLWLGSKVFEKINGKTLRMVVYGYMAIAGIVALVVS